MKQNYQAKISALQKDRNKEIIRLREKGNTLRKIAEDFGLSAEAIRKILRREKAKGNIVDKK